MRLVMRRAVEDDAREGFPAPGLPGIDPSGYAPYVGGLSRALDIAIDEARQASEATGVSVALIVAASRRRHPLDARTLARLAARYVGDGPGEVVGFGSATTSAPATPPVGSRVPARRAGRAGNVPHGGELLGPSHIRRVIEHLDPVRLGHGVRASEDPALVAEIVRRGIALELCPTSNVNMGVFAEQANVPLRPLVDAGVRIALSADDPLLFLSRQADQYRVARDVHGFSDASWPGSRRRASRRPRPETTTSAAGTPRWTPGSPAARAEPRAPPEGGVRAARISTTPTDAG